MRRKASERLNQRLAKKGVRRVSAKAQDDSSDSDDGQMPAHSDSVVASVKAVARQHRLSEQTRRQKIQASRERARRRVEARLRQTR